MRDRSLHERDMVVAWDGWPLPEILAGGIMGALIGLTLVAVPPGLNRIVPDVAGIVAGASIGAVLSWLWGPRRIKVRTQAGLTKEERTVRSRAA